METNKLAGEVFRTRFKHTHLPSITTFLTVDEGIQSFHDAPEANLFFAGAFTDGIHSPKNWLV